MAYDAHHAEGHAHAHWDTSVWPFVISFGILFLAVAFSFHFVYGDKAEHGSSGF